MVDNIYNNDGSDELLSEPTNWVLDHKPEAGEDLILQDAGPGTGDDITLDENTAELGSWVSTAYTGDINGNGDVTVVGDLKTAVGSDIITGSGTWGMTGVGDIQLRQAAVVDITGDATQSGNVYANRLTGDGSLDTNGKNIFFEGIVAEAYQFTGPVTATGSTSIWFTFFAGTVPQTVEMSVGSAIVVVNGGDGQALAMTEDLTCGGVVVRGNVSGRAACLDMNSGSGLTVSGDINLGVNGDDHQGDLALGTGDHRFDKLAITTGSTGTHTVDLESSTLFPQTSIDGDGLVVELDSDYSAVIQGAGLGVTTISNLDSVDNKIRIFNATDDGGNTDSNAEFQTVAGTGSGSMMGMG